MSIKWMTRVWASEEPPHPTDRLLLLALADTANDDGLCWPSVETLQRRSGLKTMRGARKVLRRLETRGFIERIERPGRSNVYQLNGTRLAAFDSKITDLGLDREDGTRGPGRMGQQKLEDGTPGPGWVEHQDRRPRIVRTSRTITEPSVEPSNNNRSPALRKGISVVNLLTERGVHEPVARRLAKRYDTKLILLQVKHFDYLCSTGRRPESGGWLAVAIRTAYPLPPALLQRTRRAALLQRPVVQSPQHRHDHRLSASDDTVRTAVNTVRLQLEKNETLPEHQTTRTRRPWWAQQPIPKYVLDEIEKRRARLVD